MTDFAKLVDLASERLGGMVLAANDEFFAPKENLLKASNPVYLADKYTDRGKWMDGWETRRRRTPGHDWCLIRLGLPGILRGVLVDTSHFKGNCPEACSIEACVAGEAAGVAQLTAPEMHWLEVLPKSPLKGDAHNSFPIDNPHRFTHIRFSIYPDGGVARLRVGGDVLPDWKRLHAQGDEIDLASVAHGGRIVAASDAFFSVPQNLLLPGFACNMGDGWETRRRRGPGFDWTIIRLGIEGEISRVEVDTAHFKGNYPESCSLEAGRADPSQPEAPQLASLAWNQVLPRVPLGPDARHVFDKQCIPVGAASHVRFNIFPDGGVARLRIFGKPTRLGRLQEGLRWLNGLLREDAEAALAACCGSLRWVSQILQQRPYASLAHLAEDSDRIWAALEREDWLEAFRAHPRIGESPDVHQSAQATAWSTHEQLGVSQAPQGTLTALAEANRAYEARFGYIFVVCATGKTTEGMFAILKERLGNDPETELRIAAEEQRKITRLRLEKLLTS